MIAPNTWVEIKGSNLAAPGDARFYLIAGVNAGFLGKGAAISLFLFPIMAATVFGMLQFLRKEQM